MGINYLVFNGKSSLDFGLYVGGQYTFRSPHRDVSRVYVPGKNGDLILDNGRFTNSIIDYNLVGVENFDLKTDKIREWLLEPVSYARLEDSYHPDHFREARVYTDIDFTMYNLNKSGKGVIRFDCKPQLFLKSGEQKLTFTSAGAILNPTKYDSKPIIRVYGSGAGTVTIGNQIITITDINGYTDINSDTMDCYNEATNRNAYVSLSKFPQLPSGKTGISFTGGVTNVEVRGRWWTV